MADGTITIDTEIDTSGAERGAQNLAEQQMRITNRLSSTGRAIRQLEEQMRDMEEVRVDTRLEEQQIRLTGRVDATRRHIEQLESRLEEMREVHVDTAEVERLTARIEETEEQLLSFLNERERLEEATAASLPQASPEQIQTVLQASDEWNRLNQQIEETDSSLQGYEAQLERVRANAHDQTGTQAYANTTRQLENLRNNLRLYETQLNNMPPIEHDQTGTQAYANACRRVEDLRDTYRLYETQLQNIRQAEEDVAESARNVGREGERSFRRAENSCKSFGARLKTIFAGILALNVFNIISQGLSQMGQYMSGVLKTNTQFVSSLAKIKGNLLTAFQPIYEAVLPAINALMNGLSIATAYLAKFTSALFGKNVKASQANAKELYNQANALDDVAESAEEANKQLAGIDELNVISKDSGGSGSSSSGESDEITPDFTTDIEELSTAPLKEFVNFLESKMLPVFKNAFGGMGEQVGRFKETCKGIFQDLCTLADPFKQYLTGDFLNFLKVFIDTCGLTLTGLFDSFNTVFSDIWNLVVFPIVTILITTALPMFTQFGTSVLETFQVAFEQLKLIFDTLWSECLAPFLEFVTKVITDIIELLAEFWNKWGQPIFEGIQEAIRQTGDVLLAVWDNFLKPIFDKFMEIVNQLWDEHIKPFLANFLDFVGELATGALNIYNNFIAPLVKWLVSTLGPIFSSVFSGIIQTVGTMVGNIIDAAGNIISVLKNIIQFIKNVFSGNWSAAWENVKNIFKNIFDAFVNIAKTPLNLVVGFINTIIGAIEKAINTLVKGINKLSFTTPDWLPGDLGGQEFGFHLKEVDFGSIPYLASGAVIPPNKKFLAVLGDQKNGTNIEAPADLIKEKVKEGINEAGGGSIGDYEVNVKVYLEGDASGIFRVVRMENERIKKQTGKSVLA